MAGFSVRCQTLVSIGLRQEILSTINRRRHHNFSCLLTRRQRTFNSSWRLDAFLDVIFRKNGHQLKDENFEKQLLLKLNM